MVKVSQMLRSTYRKSAERRSSVQKSKFDHMQHNNYRLSAYVSSDNSAQPYLGTHIYAHVHE